MLNTSKDKNELKKFDVDLEFGKQWEEYIDNLFKGMYTCEIKTERDKWAKTGNICIEIESYGKPSGLQVTTSDIWVQNLVKDGKLIASLVIPTENLKELTKQVPSKTLYGGDNKVSKLLLFKLEDLVGGFKWIS